jgi:adenosylcobinamide-phosphate synthase
LALAVDGLFGEPPSRLHPVVWIGTSIAYLERRAPTGPRAALAYGALMTALVVGGSAVLGTILLRVLHRLPLPLALAMEAWLLKTTLSARSLVEAGHAVEQSLSADDLAGARKAVTALVSRDPSDLDARLLASAAIESLAENTADSIVAPLAYYAVAGLPAALAYRAANTLDAMIGYRGRYEYLGKSAARIDDALNLIPARLSSLILLGAGALGGGDLATGLEITLRDHGCTASPNAGWPMSTMAGLLGTRLEKVGHYRLGEELPPPDLPAIDHAAELVKTATVLSAGFAIAAAWLWGRLVYRICLSSLRRTTRGVSGPVAG